MVLVEGYSAASSGASQAFAGGILVDNDVSLFAICDGQGPQSSQAVAEATVLKAIRTMLAPLRDERGAPEASVRMALAAVRGAIKYACAAVHRTAIEGRNYQGGGASITLLVVHGSRAVVGHLGTTKLFLMRDGACTQLTRDPEAPSKRPIHTAEPSSSAALTDVEVDTFQFEVLSGDRFMLCNRPFLTACGELEQITRALVASPTPGELPRRLMYIAESQGQAVDAGVIVVQAEIPEDRASEEQQRRDEVMLRIDSVREVFLFRELALDEILEIADRAILLVPRANQTIVKEGDEGDAMFVIIEGSCSVKVGGKVVAELAAGAHFGEMALLSNDPRSGTIVARERGRMLRIAREDFQELIRLRPATGVKLLSALGRELSRRLAQETKRR